MVVVFCSVDEQYVNPLFEVFDGGDFVLSSYRDVEDTQTQLRLYFPDEAQIPAARECLRKAGEIVGLKLKIHVSSFPDEDWTLAYRRHFKTDLLSPRLAIVPVWERAAFKKGVGAKKAAPKPLYMDPGMAFGTGNHQTTRACLQLIDELSSQGGTFLDVGCGSGILAVAASLLGFSDVDGFDIDPDAVRVANETASLNHVPIKFTRGDLSGTSKICTKETHRRYDVVAANVLGPILIRFADRIVSYVAPAGKLILSGILEEVYPAVRDAYLARGFTEEKSVLLGEWRTGLFVRTPQNIIKALIRETSSSLPLDAEKALKRAARREKAHSGARMVLETLLDNIALARKQGTPLCQDTGTLTFFISETLREKITPAIIAQAVEEATAAGWLRRNTIDSVSGKSIDTNVYVGAPVIHYVDDGKRNVSLLMKGGGSENMSRQYSLPDATLGAGRDLEGVRRCVLDAVMKAQGFGCAPGILGVVIGGDRASGFDEAKHQLLRHLDDRNDNPALAKLEKRLLKEGNALGIGPMGLGGETTLLAVKIGSRPRVPASFFVTVAYLCWAARRRTISIA